MVDIPTPLPESWVDGLRTWANQSLPILLWRGVLVVAATLVFVVAVSNGYALAGTVLGIVFSVIYADDIRQTWSDLWNLNFWVWRV